MNEGNDDYIISKIALIQNSVITWLVVGLSSWIGIIELSSSKLLHRWLIFELLLLVAIFSFGMIVAKMNDILELRDKNERLRSQSICWSVPKMMDKFFRFLGREWTEPIFQYKMRRTSIFMIILFFISQFFWRATSKALIDFFCKCVFEAIMCASAA